MKASLLLLLMLVSGCGSPALSNPEVPAAMGSNASKVTIYKITPWQVGQGDLYFGENGKSYAVLGEVGSKELILPPGKHVFEISSVGAATFKLEVALTPVTPTCIRAYTNNTNFYGKFVFPLLRNLTTEFQAEVFACPISGR